MTVLVCFGFACGEEPEASPADGDSDGASEESGEPATTMAIDASTGGEPTASTDDDDGSDEGSDETAEPPPVDPDPVFVALADGGFTSTSCDGGRTWTMQMQSDEVGDHTPWTAFGGLAFGNDAFVAGFGWGAPGHLLYSTDGLSWEALPAERFTVGGRVAGYDAFTSAVAFDGAQWLVFSSMLWRSESGEDWQGEPLSLPPGSDQVRQLRGFPGGVLVAALENQQDPSVGNFAAVSEDGGQQWTVGTGYSSSCSHAIQHWGDIEMRDGVLLVGNGDVCRSTDMGQTWEVLAEPLGPGQLQDLFLDDTGFGAVLGSRVFHSDDGATWDEGVDLGVPLSKAAYGGGVFAAVSATGMEYFWSTDGVRWQPAETNEPVVESVWVRDFTVGFPTAGCR
ncbi:MAG: sialidase family protein [Myxococcota bacterium]